MFLIDIPRFLNFYNLRDKAPLYMTIAYILSLKNPKNKILQYISILFLIIIMELGILNIYYMFSSQTADKLTGFSWSHVAPIQYIIQVLIITLIAYKTSKNLIYSTTLGFNGIVATGYLYEIPFWFFSNKAAEANLLHTSYRFTFYVDYQIIAIAVFFWLLKQYKVKFGIKDLIGFLAAFTIVVFMASKMYVWETSSINRLPMMLYFIYLTGKLDNTFIKIIQNPSKILNRIERIPSYFSSRAKNPQLAKDDVACIMCVWDEQIMVPYALESSKDFVSRYIVVDKNGNTTPIIEKCAEYWNLNVETYIEPEMGLREARLFAIEKASEPWILIQDGDEVFHTDGPYAISNLRQYMNRPDRILCTKMAVLIGDFHHTRNANPTQPPHKFLYHNNGTIQLGKNLDNIPDSKAWLKTLPGIWKFNCVIKHPRRHYLRMFWDQWCMKSDKYKTYPDIEDYVEKELGINIDEEYEGWFKKRLESFVSYNPEQTGYYPEIIRRELY